MNFQLENAVEILRQTPYTLQRMLGSVGSRERLKPQRRVSLAKASFYPPLLNCSLSAKRK
ncbi:MAG: hypothetical protein WBO10_08365 [Pyrinomonadaceae bacterium]